MTLEYLEITEMENVQKTQSVPRKLRGTLTIKDCDDLEFRADRVTGLSSQEEIASVANARLYRTVGKKQSQRVAHIIAPDNVVDIRAYLYDKVTDETKARPKLRGMILMKNDDLNIIFNKKERKIEATLRIELDHHPAYMSRLINLMQIISQCFASNQSLIAKFRK